MLAKNVVITQGHVRFKAVAVTFIDGAVVSSERSCGFVIGYADFMLTRWQWHQWEELTQVRGRLD